MSVNARAYVNENGCAGNHFEQGFQLYNPDEDSDLIDIFTPDKHIVRHAIAHTTVRITQPLAANSDTNIKTINTLGGINYELGLHFNRTLGNDIDHSAFPDSATIPATTDAVGIFDNVNPSSSASESEPGRRPLVVVDISGTDPFLLSDWGSNIWVHWTNWFRLDDLGYHYGFREAEKEVLKNFNDYIGDHNLVNPIVLITGQSRGGAVANILADDLNNNKVPGVSKESVFAYTFAAANIKMGDLTKSENIFNIINRNDIVPLLPRSLFHFGPIGWQRWHRFGRDIPVTMKYGEVINAHDMGKIYNPWETFPTRKEAKARKAEVETELNDGTYIPPSRQTIREFLQDFVALYGEDKWALSTYSNNIALIENYVNPLIGDEPIQTFSARSADMYFKRLKKMKAVSSQFRAPRTELAGPSVASNTFKLLRCAFGKAVKWEVIKRNPFELVEKPKHNYRTRDIWDADPMQHRQTLICVKCKLRQTILTWKGSSPS